jgi:hypothetical protein
MSAYLARLEALLAQKNIPTRVTDTADKFIHYRNDRDPTQEKVEEFTEFRSSSFSDHRCEVCAQRAPFGYGVCLRNGQEGLWFCAAHRPYEGRA